MFPTKLPLLLLFATVFGQNNYPNQYGNQQFGNQQFGNQQFGNQPVDGIQQSDSNCCEEYCYSTDEEPYIYFATKTAYDSLNIRTGSQHIVPDCTPVQFWSIIRQGTNLPKSSRITTLRNLNKLREEIARNYEERRSFPDRGRLCPQDYDIFRRWRWNDTITEEKGNSLTAQGVNDMKLLARRYKAKYSQILQANYDERTFYFQYTNLDRTHDSYQAYIEGLFGSEAFRVHANILNDDMLTKPYDNCKPWEETEQNYVTKNEYDRFKEKPDYLQMVRDVYRRLGFKYSLNASIINDIYDLCRYEKAWNVQQRSPWCIAFNKKQLKLLEYAEDLKYYYKSGYGNKMSNKVGCGPLKDFYERFEKTVSGNPDGTKGAFLFTHSATFQAFLTAMGIAKDYAPLTADNYYEQSKRYWKTSLIDPFAANLVAALYQCRGNEKYKVMFFLNEVPVEFPECSVGLCNWSTLQQKYEGIVRGCNVDAFCNGSAASLNHLSYFLLLLSVLYFRL